MARGSEKRIMTNTFKRAFNSRIYIRCRDMVNERKLKREAKEFAKEIIGLDENEKPSEQLRKTGNELVVMKENKVNREFRAKYGHSIRYSTTRHNYKNDNRAQEAGRKAGDAVNFNRPMGGNRSQKRIGYGG